MTAAQGAPARYAIVTRPGTCIEDGEEHVTEDRVLRVIRNLPPEERVLVIREARTGSGS
jgi:hypothetical protein